MSKTNLLHVNSRLVQRLMFQRRVLREPLTYVWWRRATPRQAFLITTTQ
jgi:hypothetical protein